MKIHKFFLANLGELIGNWPKNTLKSYKFYGRIFGPYSIYFCTKFLTTLHGTSYTTPCSTDDKFPPSKVCLFFLPKNGRWTLYAKVYTHESCTYMVLFAWHETMTANSMMHSAVDMCRKVLLPLHLVIYEFHDFFLCLKLKKTTSVKSLLFWYFANFFLDFLAPF